MIDKCVAPNRAINLQHAAIDISVAGIGVGSPEDECPRADFRQRPAAAATGATVLDDAGKGRA